MEELKYETGKTTILAFGAATAFFLLLLIVTFSPVVIFALICTGFGLLITITKYRKTLLYADHMEMLDMFGNVQMEVYYEEIKRIGFLHAHDVYGSYRTGGYSDSPTEVMVILMNDSNEVQLDASQYNNLHDICRYIQGKINEE